MSQSWTISFDDLKRTEWDTLLGETPAPYQQDWAYGQIMARKGATVVRASLYHPAGELCGLAQILVRPFALIAKFALCTYGPVWLKDVSEDDKQLALKALRKAMRLRWPRLFAITPDEAIRPKGFAQLMTGDATVRIDLTQDEETLRAALDRRWRNRLGAAERSELTFTSSASKPGQYDWLLENEARQRQSKRYHAMPADMVISWQEEKARAKGAFKKASLLVYRADLGKDTLGGMLFLLHGAMATYHIGWKSDEDRMPGTHNLILWNAMMALKERGIKTLDLGGINTKTGPGIARFKLATGGALLQRSGVWA